MSGLVSLEIISMCLTARTSQTVLPSSFQRTLGRLLPKLIHAALQWLLVGAPAHRLRAMPKPTTRDVVECHFDDIGRTYGRPFSRSLR